MNEQQKKNKFETDYCHEIDEKRYKELYNK